jgi:hypothetical protein
MPTTMPATAAVPMGGCSTRCQRSGAEGDAGGEGEDCLAQHLTSPWSSAFSRGYFCVGPNIRLVHRILQIAAEPALRTKFIAGLSK